MDYIMISSGEYSDYRVIGVLIVPEGKDTQELYREFRELYLPGSLAMLKAAEKPYYDRTYLDSKLIPASYYDEILAAVNRATNEGLIPAPANHYHLEAAFAAWLIRNHGYQSLPYGELHFDLWEL